MGEIIRLAGEDTFRGRSVRCCQFYGSVGMFIEKRREDRFSAEFSVSMVLRGKGEGEILCGPLSAEIVDISKYGARLFLESIRVEACHLFYTPRDQADCSLFMDGSSLEAEPFSVPVWPIWFDRLLLENARPFQMGVEFLLHPHDEQVGKLLKSAKKAHGEPSGLLARFGLSRPE